MHRAVIHYHGLPITPVSSAVAVVRARHAFVSFAAPEQLGIAARLCQSFALDNGAFSAWRAGRPVTDWQPFLRWVDQQRWLPGFDFAVIPDDIDGDEVAQERLVLQFTEYFGAIAVRVGAPVWHMHESLDRLTQLVATWPRVCIGSSGKFAQVGTQLWWKRMGEAMLVACDSAGRPRTKLHGLRMLNPAVFSKLPLASTDSTNIARNIGIDSAWKGTYTPPNKDVRALVMRERIEAFNSAEVWGPAALAGLL